ncbi:MAG: hypothetical protein O9972_39815 [Burkholderiales bacterium]|nr:hypothetical protein [Burkholderiales bacterium]
MHKQLTDDEVQALYVMVGSDIQSVIGARFGKVLSDQESIAVISALSSIAAIFIAQNEDQHRALMNAVINKTVQNIKASAEFQAGIAAIRAGAEPPAAVGIDEPAVAQTARDMQHEGDCMGCAINSMIAERYGETLSGESLVQVMRHLASVIVGLTVKNGQEAILVFAHEINTINSEVAAQRSTEGMTQQ